MKLKIPIRRKELAEFRKKHHIKRLSFFGSVLTEKFSNESDIDVLVDFEPGHVPGFIGLAAIELELSNLFNNRPVDLNTPNCLSPYFRDEVLAEAFAAYDA